MQGERDGVPEVRPRTRYGVRGSQFVRQWRLVLLLRRGQQTLADLSRELDCSQRTVRRDLAVLESIPLPITSWRGNNEGGIDAGGTVYWALDAMPEWPRRAVAPVRQLDERASV